MCLNSKIFRPSHVYQHSFNVVQVNAGCGKCAECREIQRNEWVNRLSFEFDSNKGGVSVFLTFTYNDAHLPFFEDSETGFKTACFNHGDVLRFLKSLENYYYHRFKCKPYKYFFAAEYGKTTKRPHYHCLFFLSSLIAGEWQNFVEVCREIWSKPMFHNIRLTDKDSLNLGWMFPSVTSDGRYIDNKGKDRTPLIQSGVKGMTYVSKYSTKDMSFYSDEVNLYLNSDNGYKLRPYLPKHWQSKKLGYSAVELASKNIENALCSGIVNPLTLKPVPLPNYVVNKLLYTNVWRGRTSYNEVTGKTSKLYDRELSEFGRKYVALVFRSRVNKTAHKMSERFQAIVNNVLPVSVPRETNTLIQSANISDIKDYKSFIALAMYHHFWRNFDAQFYTYALNYFDGCLSDMLSFSPRFDSLYTATKDQNFKRLFPITVDVDTSLNNDVFGVLSALDAVYSSVSKELSKLNVNERVKKREESYVTKEKLTHGFPLNLC